MPFHVPNCPKPENLSSSSSASCRVSVFGEPLLLVKSVSVTSSWKLCFFLLPEPNEYCVDEPPPDDCAPAALSAVSSFGYEFTASASPVVGTGEALTPYGLLMLVSSNCMALPW